MGAGYTSVYGPCRLAWSWFEDRRQLCCVTLIKQSKTDELWQWLFHDDSIIHKVIIIIIIIVIVIVIIAEFSKVQSIISPPSLLKTDLSD